MIRILIVDDDEEERNLLGQYLESMGYACSLAGNAAEARRMLKKKAFDLIISDVNMPGESGLEFLKWALSYCRDTAGIIMSGALSPEVLDAAMASGAACCLAKPIPSELLLMNLSDALRSVRFEK